MPATEAARLSLVLPVLNEGGRLPGLLSTLRRAFPTAELVVVDGGSADATVAAALRAGAQVLVGPPGRAAQMNLGAAVARGDWLLFLHADCEPAFGAAELAAVLDPASRSADGAWGFFRVDLAGRSALLPVIAWFMNRRSRLTRVATGDQGLFVHRSLFERIGGFAGIPLMEDVEVCKRLRRIARPLIPELTVAVSGRRWDEQGAVRTILRMWALRLAYWSGVSPARLWAHYYGRRALAEQVASLERGA